MLVVWWIQLGSLQLYWVDYEPSYAQNMDPTTYAHPYIQNIYMLYSKGTVKGNLKCQGSSE